MALAAISGILSTTVLGGIVLAIVVLILRKMCIRDSKKTTQGVVHR